MEGPSTVRSQRSGKPESFRKRAEGNGANEQLLRVCPEIWVEVSWDYLPMCSPGRLCHHAEVPSIPAAFTHTSPWHVFPPPPPVSSSFLLTPFGPSSCCAVRVSVSVHHRVTTSATWAPPSAWVSSTRLGFRGLGLHGGHFVLQLIRGFCVSSLRAVCVPGMVCAARVQEFTVYRCCEVMVSKPLDMLSIRLDYTTQWSFHSGSTEMQRRHGGDTW